MTDTLHDQLARLADRATPDADAVSARDLWERGRRYQRRRRAGTAVIAGVAAVLVLGIGTVNWQRSAQPPEIAPAGAPVGLPSRVYNPSPWLPGTDGHPLGQLIAVVSAERGGWFGARYATVGISATTGEYRFLDLPHQSDDVDVALAPDGRHVAYWITGPTTDTPNTVGGQIDRVTTGVAIYDTTTGEVVRHQVVTAHGLNVGVLAWVDSDSLIVDFLQQVGGDDDSDMDQAMSMDAPGLRWDIGEEARPSPELDALGLDFVGPSTSGRLAVLDGEGRFAVLGADQGQGVTRWDVGTSMTGQFGVAIDPSGTQVAGIATQGGRSPNRVGIANLPQEAERSTRYRELPRSDRSFRVVGWTDDEHVLVQRRVGRMRDCLCMGLYEMDVRSGAADVVVELPEGWFNQGQWATDLLDAPVVDRPAPPTPMSPRLTLSLLVLTLGGAAFGVWRWRRRVEP